MRLAKVEDELYHKTSPSFNSVTHHQNQLYNDKFPFMCQSYAICQIPNQTLFTSRCINLQVVVKHINAHKTRMTHTQTHLQPYQNCVTMRCDEINCCQTLLQTEIQNFKHTHTQYNYIPNVACQIEKYTYSTIRQLYKHIQKCTLALIYT